MIGFLLEVALWGGRLRCVFGLPLSVVVFFIAGCVPALGVALMPGVGAPLTPPWPPALGFMYVAEEPTPGF